MPLDSSAGLYSFFRTGFWLSRKHFTCPTIQSKQLRLTSPNPNEPATGLDGTCTLTSNKLLLEDDKINGMKSALRHYSAVTSSISTLVTGDEQLRVVSGKNVK